jgi:hypothetical protein
MQTKITAMLIMARERRLPLLEALESCGIDVLPVCDCNEGRRILETEPKVQLVLTDAALPDGDWRGGASNRGSSRRQHRSSRLLTPG